MTDSPGAMMDVSTQVKKGAAWIMLGKLITRGLSFVSTIILAHLLAPSDFGLLAMAAAVVALLEMMSTFGFDAAIIQNRRARRRHYDTAWTLKILIGFAVALAMFALAIPTAMAFSDRRLVSVMRWLALAPLIGGFENIGVVNFCKDLEFHRDVRYDLATRGCAFIVNVTAAVLLQNYWALVIGIILGKFCGVAWSYQLHPYRPWPSLRAWRKLLGFSKWILLNNFVSYFYLRSADVIVGATTGASAVGVLRMSYDLSNMPTNELIAPLNRAIFPGYAQMAADRQRLSRAFMKTISIIALFAIPAAVGIAASADILIPPLLGPQWHDAIPVVQVLALFGAITALETNTYYVHLALGNIRRFTGLVFSSAITLVVLVAVLSPIAGAVGAAMAYLMTAVAFFAPFYWIVMRVLDLKLRTVAGAFVRPVTASAVMYSAVRYAARFVEPSSLGGECVVMFAVVMIGGLSYCAALLVCWRVAGHPAGSEKFIITTVGDILRQGFAWARTTASTVDHRKGIR